MRVPLVLSLCFLSLCFFALSCSSAPAVRTITLGLQLDPQANAGMPVRVVVADVDEATFAKASYTSIEERALLTGEWLASETLLPSRTDRVSLPIAEPRGGHIAVYVLFTEPGEGGWKYPLAEPIPDEVWVRVDTDWVGPGEPPPGWFAFLKFW